MPTPSDKTQPHAAETKNSSRSGRNEGEGSRSAARNFNQSSKEFVRSGKVDRAAKSAKDAVEGKEQKSLRSAEEKGRARAKEVDPAVHRDHGKGKS